MSASSSWNKNLGPENARLNLVATGGKTGAWSAEINDRNQFLQVDFSRNVKITKFQTQGRQDADQWVKKYTLSYSVDGSSAFQIHQENGVNKVFNGNNDRNSIVTHVLVQPITARYVQIKPTEWHGHISMRAEFRGCVLSGKVFHGFLSKFLHKMEHSTKNGRFVWSNFWRNKATDNNIVLSSFTTKFFMTKKENVHTA